ncbi:accessory gene regulator B family protein [Fusibacter ferrireducens]|uniref:Accessory gene regulator B family protein n=1 Tax=Fusibacter ferrireducens TaxID=2785058 RepID=A0ABR9ZSC1_9FIRM|nr:accessory gene regulator B family protein [Fusibacter ferrireducens]MBF4693355.1 accessory gene regulator B family protein [Fusibacter ferrireducens]
MIQRLSTSICVKLDTLYAFSPLEVAKLNYILTLLISELSKLIILWIGFRILGGLESAVLSILTLAMIRTFTGGLHFNQYYKCLMFTFGFLMSVCLLSKLIQLHTFTILLMLLFNIIVIRRFAPITSLFRPPFQSNKKRTFQITAILIVIFHALLLFKFNHSIYSINANWVITLNSLQLIMAKQLYKSPL